MKSLLVVIVFVLMIFSGTVSAQYGSFGLTDARQLALGNTFATNSRELYAAGKNPALMAERRYDRQVSILFPNLSSRSYNLRSTTSFLNDYFSQRPIDIITGIDGSIIKKALQANGRIYLGLQIGYLALGYSHSEKTGYFSFAIKDYLTSYLQLPNIIVRINDQQEKVDYLFGFRDFDFRAQWIRAYEVNYARAFRFENLSGIQVMYAGIGLKYYNGFVYNDIKLSSGIGYSSGEKLLVGSFSASLQSAWSDDFSIKESFSTGSDPVSNVPFMKPAGRGIGIDLGLATVLAPGVKIGVSVTDIGYIKWSGKTRRNLVAGTIDIDSLLNDPAIERIVNSIQIVQEQQGSFKTSPPTALHMGMGIQVDHFVTSFPGEMGIALEIHHGLNNEGVNLDYPRLAMGVDWKPGRRWPIILAGITNSSLGKADLAFGLGYELPFLEIYITSPDISQYFDNEDLSSLSVSMCWHFFRDRKEKLDGSLGKKREKKK